MCSVYMQLLLAEMHEQDYNDLVIKSVFYWTDWSKHVISDYS